jgi:hypothetical protein
MHLVVESLTYRLAVAVDVAVRDLVLRVVAGAADELEPLFLRATIARCASAALNRR